MSLATPAKLGSRKRSWVRGWNPRPGPAEPPSLFPAGLPRLGCLKKSVADRLGSSAAEHQMFAQGCPQQRSEDDC